MNIMVMEVTKMKTQKILAKESWKGMQTITRGHNLLFKKVSAMKITIYVLILLSKALLAMVKD